MVHFIERSHLFMQVTFFLNAPQMQRVHSPVHNLAFGYYMKLPTMIPLTAGKHGNLPGNFPRSNNKVIFKEISPSLTHFEPFVTKTQFRALFLSC